MCHVRREAWILVEALASYMVPCVVLLIVAQTSGTILGYLRTAIDSEHMKAA